MNYRKLRIAWSVVWGIVAVLLIALWVQSYTYRKMWGGPVPPFDGILVNSIHGRISVIGNFDGRVTPWSTGTTYAEASIKKYPLSAVPSEIFYFGRIGNFIKLVVPYSLVTLLALIFGTLSWLPWRFNGRSTLLIATTLIAVGLGLVVWLR